MNWNGKVIGILIGAFLSRGNLLGILIGLLLGHLYDMGFFQHWFKWINVGYEQAHTQHVFFDTTFAVMGHLAKSDGRVTESDIRAAKNIMGQMGLSSHLRHEAIRLFNQGKQPNFDLTQTIHRLKQAASHHPTLLNTFLEIQLQIANASGHISPVKRRILQTICSQLGIKGFAFEQFEQRARAEQNYQHHFHQLRPDPQQQLKNAYQILNIGSLASNAEVKKAYRRMMSKHHPDKLIAKGLPPEMIKIATEKTQKIKAAYETIAKERGMKT